MRFSWILAVLILPIFCIAQSNISLHLKTGKAKLPETKQLNHIPAPNASEIVSGKYYRYIQFHQLPTQRDRETIETLGIELLDYVPKNTYIASVLAGFNWQDVDGFQIRSIAPIPAFHKIDPRMEEKPLPGWATEKAGFIKADITFQKNITLSLIHI